MILQWVKNARHLGNIVTSQLKDDMDIQFYGAVNSLCAKFRGILQDINVASKLFYSYCCSFYGCQLWDLSSNYIEDIYVAWQKAIRRIFNLPCNTHRYLLPFVAGSSNIRVNLVNRFNNFFNALMSSDNKIIELLVYNCHFSNTPLGLKRKFMNMYNCYKCNEVEEAHGALLLSLLNVRCTNWSVLSFRKMRLNVWFMMFVSINLDILWWCIFQMSEYLLFHARLSCMNDLLLWYLYLFTLICSSVFVYWDLLNPKKLLNTLNTTVLTFCVILIPGQVALIVWLLVLKYERQLSLNTKS